MNKENYQKKLEGIIEMHRAANEAPAVLLHSCCAPCSSYCIEYLCKYFRVTVFYYNPNISALEEYRKRAEEQKRLIAIYNEEIDEGSREGHGIDVIEGEYAASDFFDIAKGYEDCPEGGERCFRCYELRLERTAREAASRGKFSYFATTLTLSPLKNADKLNEIGARLGEKYEVEWLFSDFKNKNGYKRSIELSKEYGLYRQNYCGCVYSKTLKEV